MYLRSNSEAKVAKGLEIQEARLCYAPYLIDDLPVSSLPTTRFKQAGHAGRLLNKEALQRLSGGAGRKKLVADGGYVDTNFLWT
jgi:hypothetical protein